MMKAFLFTVVIRGFLLYATCLIINQSFFLMKKLIAIAACLALFGAGCTATNSTPTVNINFDQNAAAAFTPVANNNESVTNDNNTMKTWPAPTVLPEAERTNKEAVVETNKGTIVFELLPDAPLTASNFIELAKAGYYDGLTFHRVISGFMIQGGDPTGTGAGGPGYRFKDEPVQRAYDPGIVAMANSGPDTNGSQFFIMEPDSTPTMLQPLYTIFGKVVSGLDVVGKIQIGDVMKKVTIQDKR